MQIIINNQNIDVSGNETLIEIAEKMGIEIPSLCYAKGAKHKSSCMVCVVQNCENGQILPACSTLPTEGMKIETDNEEIKLIRKMSLELLMSDHIAKCVPPCNPKACKLRILANEYKAKSTTYPKYSALKEVETQQISENLRFEVAKCIRCGLCVYNTENGFTFKDRGFCMQVVLPEENAKNVSEEVAKLCPMQAIYQLRITN